MHLFLYLWALLLVLVLAMGVEGSIFGLGPKKMGKLPAKFKMDNSHMQGVASPRRLSSKKKLSEDYINGMLSIQGRMLFNTVNKPSSLKLYRRAYSVESPIEYESLENYSYRN